MKLGAKAGFFGRIGEESIGSIGERFPQRLRTILLLSLAGVTLVAILVRAPLLGNSLTASDTDSYLAVAKGIFHGGFANNSRPPGYATLLAIFELFGANPVKATVVLQNLLGMVLPAFVLLVGWRFFSPVVGIVAGFFTAASPLTIAIEQFALSDFLFSVLVLVGAALLAEAVLRLHRDTSACRWLVGAGIFFGLATLFRANGLIAIVSMPVALLIGGPRWRPALRAAAISTLTMVVVLAPWCIHNLVSYDDPNIASESGVALYAKAISYDEVPPSPDLPGGQLALSIFNTAAFTGEPEAEVHTTSEVFKALVEEGESPTEASSTMAALARHAISEHPDVYLESSLEMLGRYQGLYNPHTFAASGEDQIASTTNYIRAQDPKASEVPGDSRLTRLPWQIAQTLTMALYVLTIGGLLMLALPFFGAARSRLAASTFLIVGVFGLVGVTLTARWEARHGIAFAPLIWILGTATAALLIQVLVAAVRRRPWRRAQDPTP